MAQVKLRGDVEGTHRLVYGEDTNGYSRSWQITRTNYIKVPDHIAETLNPELYKIKELEKKKSEPKKKETGMDKKELKKMTKLELDKYAEEEYGIKLDRRLKKKDMIKNFLNERKRL